MVKERKTSKIKGIFQALKTKINTHIKKEMIKTTYMREVKRNGNCSKY